MTRTARFAVLFLLTGTLAFSLSRAQDAAPPTVNLQAKPAEESSPVASPTPIPDVPELSTLDEAFKRTSLGKAADENRQRVEIRKLQNRVANDQSVVEAKAAASLARTDLEKRERLREYYDIYYGAMERFASGEGTKKALADAKAEHLRLLDQPRVRPVPGVTATPEPKKKTHGKHSHSAP